MKIGDVGNESPDDEPQEGKLSNSCWSHFSLLVIVICVSLVPFICHSQHCNFEVVNF